MLVPTLIQQATSDTTKVLLINGGQSWLQTWLPNIIPAAVAIIVVWVSIRAIRKTADASRISNIHFEMYKCLYETCKPLSQMIIRLEAVAHGTVSTLEGKIVGTAYEEYIEQNDRLSDQYNAVLVKQELLLPEELLIKLRSLIRKLNKAKRTANLKVMHPLKHETNMDAEMFERFKKDLEPEVKEIVRCYEDLINDARNHIGSSELKPIGNLSELRLLPEREVTNDN